MVAVAPQLRVAYLLADLLAMLRCLPDGVEAETEVPGSEAACGVYAPPRPRRVLHSEVVAFRTAELRRRMPRIAGDDSFLAVTEDAP